VTPVAGGINLGGLSAPVIAVQVWNNAWVSVYNQTLTNSPGTISISSLPLGSYHVKVNFNSASWTGICEKFTDAVVSTTSSPNITSATATEKAPGSQHANITLLSSNPVKDVIKFSIELDREEKIVIIISDVQGRRIFEKSTLCRQGKQEIQLASYALPSGNYVLKVMGNTFAESKKILKF
jgi:hypothetical protein